MAAHEARTIVIGRNPQRNRMSAFRTKFHTNRKLSAVFSEAPGGGQGGSMMHSKARVEVYHCRPSWNAFIPGRAGLTLWHGKLCSSTEPGAFAVLRRRELTGSGVPGIRHPAPTNYSMGKERVRVKDATDCVFENGLVEIYPGNWSHRLAKIGSFLRQ
ncbi:MAG: hypothetical protein WAN92_07720 [Herbaspirillum sp.]